MSPYETPGRGREDGVTLIEAVVAAAVLLIAAIGLMPLFARAALNNVAGADANQATQHARSELDRLLALRFDDPTLDLGNPPPEQTVQDSSAGEGGEEMLLGDVFWDEGAKASIPAQTRRHCNLLVGAKARTVDGRLDCIRLGEGGWVADTDDARGLVFWQRRSVIRQFTYADISDGVIDASGSQLVTLGDARLFDRPLGGDAPRSAVHFREQSVELSNERAGGGAVDGRESPDGATLDLGPTSFRSRLVRTF